MMNTTKSSRIEIRTDPENKRLIEKAAAIKGETISSYILGQSLSSAKRDIEEMEIFNIGNKDRDLFFSLISDPPAPNKALQNLMKSDSSSRME